MSVVSVGTRSLLLTQSLVGMRTQLGDLQRQLATGKRADDYAGIGIERGLTVGLRAHLSAIGAYNDTHHERRRASRSGAIGACRASRDIGREVKSVVNQSTSIDGRTTAQVTANASLGEMLGLLNTKAGDRYLFSGLASDQPSVQSLQQILDGDAGRAGLKQIVAERLQADLGTAGLGRVGGIAAGADAGGLDRRDSGDGFRLQAFDHLLDADRLDRGRARRARRRRFRSTSARPIRMPARPSASRSTFPTAPARP